MKKNINILIVEDEIIASEYLNIILNDLGFKNIYNLSSAKEAISFISLWLFNQTI